MDLGKMLAEALRESSSRTPTLKHISMPMPYHDFHAAAEAFLTKVREAEDAAEDQRKEARQTAEMQRREAGPLMSPEDAEAYFQRQHE